MFKTDLRRLQYYAFGGLCGNEFEDSFYDCPLEGGADNPECASYTGTYIMDNLGFPKNWIARPILAMVGFVGLFLITSWIGLAYLKVEMLGGLVSGTEESRGKISLDRPNRQWDYP